MEMGYRMGFAVTGSTARRSPRAAVRPRVRTAVRVGVTTHDQELAELRLKEQAKAQLTVEKVSSGEATKAVGDGEVVKPAVEPAVEPSVEPAVEVEGDNAQEKRDAKAVFDYVWPRAVLLMIAGIWGTNFGTVKLLDESMRSSASAMGRFTLAALVLSPTLFKAPRGLLKEGAIIGAWVAAGYFFQANALQYSEANKTAFLCSLSVVFVPLFTKLFPSEDHEEKASSSIASVILAVFGVGLLTLGSSSEPSVGDLFGLAQAMCFGMGYVNNERAIAKYPDGAIPLSASQLVVVALGAAVWYTGDSLHTYGNLDLQGLATSFSDPLVAGAIAYTGLITTAITVVLENIALLHVSASELTLLLSTEPFFASGFSAFLLGETLTSQGIVGGVLIISACLSNQLSNLIPWRPPSLGSMWGRISGQAKEGKDL